MLRLTNVVDFTPCERGKTDTILAIAHLLTKKDGTCHCAFWSSITVFYNSLYFPFSSLHSSFML